MFNLVILITQHEVLRGYSISFHISRVIYQQNDAKDGTNKYNIIWNALGAYVHVHPRWFDDMHYFGHDGHCAKQYPLSLILVRTR